MSVCIAPELQSRESLEHLASMDQIADQTERKWFNKLNRSASSRSGDRNTSAEVDANGQPLTEQNLLTQVASSRDLLLLPVFPAST